MGPEEVKLASLVEYGSPNATIMQTEFPKQFFYSTNNVEGKLTDSAAGGTAIATGQLTANSVISMDETETIKIKTILEYLRDDFGYATGLVTTTEFAHATPAVFGSHTGDRDNKKSIRDQLLSSNIDLILGGGREVSYVGGAEAAKSLGENHGYVTVTSRDELLSVENSVEKILGVFGTTNMPYELERDPNVDPSIIEMTQKGIEFLDSKNKPFFLMIEGGRIDHSGHLPNNNENKTLYNAMETIMFEKAVRKALEFAKQDGNTILVVAADHETGGLQVHDYTGLDNILPDESLSRDENNEIRMRRVAQINATFSTSAHTETKVPFFGFGSDFGNVLVDTIDDVFWAVNGALGKFPTIRNDRVSIENGTLQLTFEIMDLDLSADSYEIIQQFENGTEKTSGKIGISDLVQNNKFEYQIQTLGENFTYFIKVHDSTVSVTSLAKTYRPISPTTEPSTENSLNYQLLFALLSLPVLVLLQNNRRKKFLEMNS